MVLSAQAGGRSGRSLVIKQSGIDRDKNKRSTASLHADSYCVHLVPQLAGRSHLHHKPDDTMRMETKLDYVSHADVGAFALAIVNVSLLHMRLDGREVQ